MPKLKILIVEDESLIALELSQTICDFGYEVIDYATTPKMTLEIFEKEANNIDLILMDINLNSTINGIELYKRLNTTTALVYLTAYKDAETITKAIETNPLGYLIKPINEDELKALLQLTRHKIQASKEKPQTSITHSIGEDYYFDMEAEQLFYKDIFLNLGKKEKKLLKLLIEAKGEVVSFKTVEDAVWEGEFVSDSALRTLIYRLRGKLEYKLIETVFNRGIKLNLI